MAGSVTGRIVLGLGVGVNYSEVYRLSNLSPESPGFATFRSNSHAVFHLKGR